MKNRFFVKEKSLLLIAGIVWLMAGFNVARLGVLSYLQIERQWYLYLLSMLVFFLFGRMFFKMSKKHTKRIIAYEEYRPFWHFFSTKGLYYDGLHDGWRHWSACRRGFSGYICCVFLFRLGLCLGIGRRSVCKKLFMLSQFDGKGTGSMREII